MVSLVLKVLVIIFFLYILIGRNIFYVDPANSCFITVVPGLEFNNAKIVKGLDVLKKASFEDYQQICQYIDQIDPNVDCGGFEGGCFRSGTPKTISVSVSNQGLDWVTSVLVHETCHAKQHAQGRGSNKNECYQEADRVMKKIVLY